MAASAETSLTSISRVRLRQLVEQKVPQAILIERLHHDPNAYLSTILIVNTVAIIVASSTATLLALHLYQERVAEWAVSLVLSLVVLVACEVKEPVEKAVELVTKHGHTRIPVYEGNLDHIVGVLYAKDLLRAVVRGEQKALREIARKPYFTPESNKVQDVLRDLRKNRVHMAIVVDEYGGTAGAVTIEDIIEEIVGPIQDEYDVGEEDEIQFISPNEVVLDGRVSVDDVNELLKLQIAADDFDTIGGYVLNQLGAAPRVGDTLPIGQASLRVEGVRGTRIKKVRIHSEAPFEIPEAAENSPSLSSSPEAARDSESRHAAQDTDSRPAARTSDTKPRAS